MTIKNRVRILRGGGLAGPDWTSDGPGEGAPAPGPPDTDIFRLSKAGKSDSDPLRTRTNRDLVWEVLIKVQKKTGPEWGSGLSCGPVMELQHPLLSALVLNLVPNGTSGTFLKNKTTSGIFQNKTRVYEEN